MRTHSFLMLLAGGLALSLQVFTASAQNRSLKVQVTAISETVSKADAPAMYKELL